MTLNVAAEQAEANAFAEEMRVGRALKKWTIEDLAREAGLGRMTIIRYEKGEARKNSVINKIRAALGGSASNSGDDGFSRKLRGARALKRISIKNLSKLSGVSRPTIIKYESGGARTPAKEKALRDALGMNDDTAALSSETDRPPFASIGEAILVARKASGKSQDEVATAAAVSRVTLIKYESGDVTKLDELMRIATVVGLPLNPNGLLGLPTPSVAPYSFFCSHCGRKNILETK